GRQSGIPVHTEEGERRYRPAVYPAQAKPPYVGVVPNYFYSWSALAELNPYLEQTPIYNRMNLDEPMYTLPSLTVLPDNRFAVEQVVKLFLCPADYMQPVGGAYGVPL